MRKNTDSEKPPQSKQICLFISICDICSYIYICISCDIDSHAYILIRVCIYTYLSCVLRFLYFLYVYTITTCLLYPRRLRNSTSRADG